MSNVIDINLNGVNYPCEWSMGFYDAFEQSSGCDFFEKAARVMNLVSDLHENALYKNNPKSLHNEYTELLTSVFSRKEATFLIYEAAKRQNSLITLAEIQDGVFNVGLNPNDGYQYIVLQFVTFAMSFGGETEKKSSTPSLLYRLRQALFQPLS